MSKLKTVERARQGEPVAIATLMNKALKPKGITVKVAVKEACLRILLEGECVPSQRDAIVLFIRQRIEKLKIESIASVKIYGKQKGQNYLAWKQELNLSPLVTKQVTDLVEPEIAPEQVPTSFPIELEEKGNVRAKLKAAGVPKRLGQVLQIVLGLRLFIDSLFVLYSLIWLAGFEVYNLLKLTDATGLLGYLLRWIYIAIDGLWNPLEALSESLYIVTMLMVLIWLHRLHGSLRKINPQYRISPWGAVGRYVIPIYSLWGIWNLWATLAQFLKTQGGQLEQWGKALRRSLPGYYIFSILANVLDRLYWYQYRNYSDEQVWQWLFPLRNFVLLLLTIALFSMVRIVGRAMVYQVSISPKVTASKVISERDKMQFGHWLLVLGIFPLLLVGFKLHEKALTSDNKMVKAFSNKIFKVKPEDYEALASYDKAIEITPEFYEAWNYRGWVLYKLERYQEALVSYDEAIKIKSNFHEAWNNRGIVLYELGRYQEALASYDEAIKIQPDKYKAWNNRGKALESLKRYEEALDSYEKAIKFNSNYQTAIDNRKNLLAKLRR